jgi:hypothetical protein
MEMVIAASISESASFTGMKKCELKSATHESEKANGSFSAGQD